MPARKGQGQWALGYREPLNQNERAKRDSDGLDVRQRIIDIYQHTGFAGIDPADLRGRFRWYGLYTQRRPGIPGGKTAIARAGRARGRALHAAHPRRRRCADHASNCASSPTSRTEFGRGIADLTDRQNVQLHWVRIEDVPEIWERLEAVGLSTTEACGDTPRVILGCPLEGVAADSVLDAGPALRETVEKYLGDPEFSNLPRKFKTSISGCAQHCTNHEINDVSFVGVIGPDGEPGFDLWVGGGLSTNPRFAERLGVFVRPDEVSEVWAGVVSVFRDYGYRRSRTHSRLKFLMADWGPGQVPQGAAGRVPAAATARRRRAAGLRPRIVTTPASARRATVWCRSARPRSRDARRVTRCAQVAALAEQYGTGRIGLTAQQGIVVIDVDPARADELATELDAIGLTVRPSAFRRGTIACTGIEFCKLALVETKQRAATIQEELEKRLPDFDTPITINVNGCPNSCARFQVADIGFKGVVAKGVDGDEDAFQVHLGGLMGENAEFGRKFRGLRVTAAEAPDYAERVLRGYLERREDDESFASYVARADETWLH